MLPSSRESKIAQLAEALAQTHSEFFFNISERRNLVLRIQELKESTGRYPHYDPEKELETFLQLKSEISKLSIKELLAFSLIIEDQAQAFAPGAYPSWSQSGHLQGEGRGLVEMINPLLLKVSHPEIFGKLRLTSEFAFLKDFSLP